MKIDKKTEGNREDHDIYQHLVSNEDNKTSLISSNSRKKETDEIFNCPSSTSASERRHLNIRSDRIEPADYDNVTLNRYLKSF